MSRCLVTGAAGFIGSHLCEALLRKGHDVVGLDAFIPYYPRAWKEQNLAGLRDHDRFHFHEADLREADLGPLVRDCEVIFNEAAMPGLVRSWSDFALYSSCNELGLLRLLEAAREADTPHLIQISTSSVYGREATGPEDSPLRPFSPYGITKLAAEQLCRAYEANFGLPVTILRYFSVYGPRQRPDMAYHILIRGLLEQAVFPLCGDGEQTRSNTYVADCVEATVRTFERRDRVRGEVLNIGGGEIVSLNKVIGLLEEQTGRRVRIEAHPARPGDQRHTAADITKARDLLDYRPSVPVAEGLAAEAAWLQEALKA